MKKSLFFCVEKSEGKEMGCEIRCKKRCVQGKLLASTSYCSSVRVSKKMMMYFLFLFFLNTKVYYYSVAQYESKSVKENDDLYFIFYIFYMHIFIIIILKVPSTFYFF